MKIHDISTLQAYIKSVAAQYLEMYYYMDATPEGFADRLKHFYSNINTGNQPALLFTIVDNEISTNGSGYSNAFMCQLMILQKADKNDQDNLVEVRNRTWKLSMQVLGQLLSDSEAVLYSNEGDTPEDVENGKWTITLPEGKLFPEADVAGLGAYGYSMPFDIAIPVNAVMFNLENI